MAPYAVTKQTGAPPGLSPCMAVGLEPAACTAVAATMAATTAISSKSMFEHMLRCETAFMCQGMTVWVDFRPHNSNAYIHKPYETNFCTS